jgi:integrase
VSGKVVRAGGQGLQRHDTAKTEAGLRTLPPRFAVNLLTERRQLPFLGEQTMIFPSTSGTLRDPNNFNKQWRHVRDELGAAGVTTHSFHKSLATLIDDEGSDDSVKQIRDLGMNPAAAHVLVRASWQVR